MTCFFVYGERRHTGIRVKAHPRLWHHIRGAQIPLLPLLHHQSNPPHLKLTPFTGVQALVSDKLSVQHRAKMHEATIGMLEDTVFNCRSDLADSQVGAYLIWVFLRMYLMR